MRLFIAKYTRARAHWKFPSFLGRRKRAQYVLQLIGWQLIPKLRNYTMPVAERCPFCYKIITLCILFVVLSLISVKLQNHTAHFLM